MNLGYMQGRLSPLIDGKIQAFPLLHWEAEFVIAKDNEWCLMEWTLDHEKLSENPFVTKEGRMEIRALCEKNGVSIPSVTGDCFMQAPFFKAQGDEQTNLLDELRLVISSCGELGVKYVVFPLVDNGSIETKEQEAGLIGGLNTIIPLLEECQVQIVFESDFNSSDLKRFIEKLDSRYFGINYDVGNSAALGYDHKKEISVYGQHIKNVHVKDRVLGGTTVPLGRGAADFPGVLRELEKIGYKGNYIFQTARAEDDDHAKMLNENRKFFLGCAREIGL